MKPMKNVEEAIRKKLRLAATSTLRDQLRKEVLQAQEGLSRTKPALREPIRRSVLMTRSRIKIALAAVVILAVVLGLCEFLSPGSKSGVAWATVLERTEQIPAVAIDMTAEIPSGEGQTFASTSKNYIAAGYGVRSDLYRDGQLYLIRYKLLKDKVAYQVRVDLKKYWRIPISNQAATDDMDDPRMWLKTILSGDYTELGRSTINGITVEGIEASRPEMAGKDGVMRLWVDVRTELPVQIEVEMTAPSEGQMRLHKFTMTNFEWNAQIDESLFEPNIPDDYTEEEFQTVNRNQPGSSKAQPVPTK